MSDSNDTDICGAECTDGTPCQNPAGSCPVPSHSDPDAENPHGRPSKLTKQRQENIAAMIEDGHSIGAAARSTGITVQTFFNWMERGEQQDEGVYGDFFDRITRARGVGESRYLDAIVDIAKETNDTATLMTLLKSRYPNSWGDAERADQDAGGVQVVLPAEADP
jgi:hypothetical protein